MTPHRLQLIILAAALALGLLAWITPFLPPFPLPGWFIGGAIVGPFERWWYSLPDGSRSIFVYDVGTTIGAGLYPVLVIVVFWLWCRPLRRGENFFPRRTPILALGAVALSAAYFTASWRYGLQYQGVSLVLTYIGVSVMALLVLWLCWIRARRTSSWWGSLGVHWGLFVWLCVFAFPWLGEMI